MPTLIALPYSPWTERARFALGHHGIPYERIVHEPLLGEIPWRLRTGRWRGRATVPVLLDGETALFDSFDIARYADSNGRGTKLIPPGTEATIADFNAASERGLASGRKRSFDRLLADEDALAANLRTLVPKGLRRAMLPVAKSGVAFMRSKYDTRRIDEVAIERELEALRTALAAGGGEYLLGTFTYADITMSALLHFVEPIPERFVPVDDHVRRTFRDPVLAAAYPDLVAWRDRLYARHSPPAARVS